MSPEQELTTVRVSSTRGRWSEYTQLSRQIKQAGLLDRRRGWYAARIGSNLALLAGGWTIFLVLVLSPLQALAFVVVQQGLFGLYLGCAFAPNHAVRHLHAVGAPLRLAPATD
jgi:hypothetical protein